MKKIIAIALCFSLVGSTIAEPPKQNGLGPAMLVLGFTVAAAALVFWVYVKDGSMTDPVDLVLEESPDGLPTKAGGHWTPVQTNYGVVLDGRKLVDVFDPVLTRNENHFYRVVIIK